MSFFKRFNPFSRKTGVEAQEKKGYYPIAEISRGSFLEYSLYGEGRLRSRQAFQFYRKTSSVAIAVDAIADEIEFIQPVLKRKDGQIIDSHPVLDLLKNPNPHQDGSEFLGDMARYWLLTHQAPVFAGGTVNRPPAEIWATTPERVSETAEQTADQLPHQYSIYTGIGKGTFIRNETDRKLGWRFYDGPIKELYVINGFTSRTYLSEPDSPLEAIAMEVRQHIQGRWHNLSLLENGARLSLVAVFKDTMDQEQHDMRRMQINEQLTGSENAGKTAVISSEDVELKEFGMSNKDMDFAELQNIVQVAIMNRYKVPLPLISMDASTFNNMEQAVFHLYDRAVLPNYMRLMKGLSKMLLPRFGESAMDMELSYNPEQIGPLRMRKVEELEKRKSIGIETLNELRADLPNRPPVEGGDEIYQPATLVPVARDPLAGDEGFTEDELRRQVSDDSV